MKDRNRIANQVLADMTLFDYLKEKVGERKTKTGAYHDLLEKASAGFVVPFLKNHEYELQDSQCHVTITDLAGEWHWHRATVRAFLDRLEEMGYISRTRFAKSVVITVTFVPTSDDDNAQSATGHAEAATPDALETALSGWINGSLSDEDARVACGQYLEAGRKRLAGEHGEICTEDGTTSQQETETELVLEIAGRVLAAGLKRATRDMGVENPTVFTDFFQGGPGDDRASLMDASVRMAESMLVGRKETADRKSGTTDMLATIRQPFRALWGKNKESDSSLL